MAIGDGSIMTQESCFQGGLSDLGFEFAPDGEVAMLEAGADFVSG